MNQTGVAHFCIGLGEPVGDHILVGVFLSGSFDSVHVDGFWDDPQHTHPNLTFLYEIVVENIPTIVSARSLDIGSFPLNEFATGVRDELVL
jgi:hypothetical protein